MADQIEAYLSDIDWEEKIIAEGVEQNSKKWLLTDIASYLEHEYDIPASHPNNLSLSKAKELMDGQEPQNKQLRQQPPVVVGKSDRERKIVFKKIVRDAQKKGYIQNFRLSEPWHPKLFMEGEMNTFPYQHNSMITYRGVSRDHFYLGGDNPEGKGRNATKRHQDSVLNLGHWNPGNSFNENNDDAVWTTFKRTAGDYANRKMNGKEGVLLKMQVPTKWVQCGAHNTIEVHNLEEMRKEFGSPEAYREYIKSTSDVNCAWLIRPKVPLNYIIKVWDLAVFNSTKEEYALPLQSKNRIDAIDLMHVFQKQKMPEQPRFGDAENHQEARKIIKMQDLVSKNTKLARNSQNLLDELQNLENVEFEIKIAREIMGQEESLNRLIRDIVEISEELGVSMNLDRRNVESLQEVEQSIADISHIAQEIDQHTEESLANLISNGHLPGSLGKILGRLYVIETESPQKINAIKTLYAKNNQLEELSHELVKNFRDLKIGYSRKRGMSSYRSGAAAFDKTTEEICEQLEGPNKGINQAVKELGEAARKAGLDVNVTEKKVDNLEELQDGLGTLLKISRDIDQRVEGSIANIISTGRMPSSAIKELQQLYLVAPSEEFESNAKSSKDKIRNEFRVLKNEIDEGIQILNWFHQLEVRLAEVVRITEDVQQQGNMAERQLWDLGNALFSYEKQGDKRYGINELIERSRRKLGISRDADGPEKSNLESLREGCRKRLEFMEERKEKIEKVETEFKQMRKEAKKLSSDSQMSKNEIQDELEKMQQEYEKLMSEDGEIYKFFDQFKGIGFEYQKYKSKVQN